MSTAIVDLEELTDIDDPPFFGLDGGGVADHYRGSTVTFWLAAEHARYVIHEDMSHMSPGAYRRGPGGTQRVDGRLSLNLLYSEHTGR